MSDCLFCKIVAEEIFCYKVREDENFVAFLDIFPNCKGQTLVIPKKHYDSDILAQDNAFISKIFLASKKVVNILKKWLWVERVGLVVEWLEVNHAHVKLYPFQDEKGFHGSVKPWPQAENQDLEKLIQEIREKN